MKESDVFPKTPKCSSRSNEHHHNPHRCSALTTNMTFEEIQQAIQQMLTIQRELQESQLRLAEQQAVHDQQISTILQVLQETGERQIQRDAEQNRQEQILNRLIGYSLANETDHLNLEERMMRLEQRIQEIRGT